MLNALRRGSKTIFAKLLIGVLVIGFALFGVSEFVNQVNPTEVARAGATPVSAAEFVRVYERARANTGQRIGRNLTPDESAALGVPSQVLQALLTDAMQIDAAHALGLDLGDDALAERVRQDPLFQVGGRFDRQRFDFMLAENRYNENEYLDIERAEAAREMYINGLLGGLSAPEPYLKAFNRFQNQRRRIASITLSEANLPAAEAPTDAQLRTFFDDNKSDFRAPEYRTISIVALTPEAIADPAAITEAEIETAYARDGAFGRPERRAVQQVVLADKAAAENAAEQLNGGADFNAILAEMERAFAEVDLGLVTREDLIDPAVADAAFSLDVNNAAAVDGRFGPVLVRVSEIQDSGKAPLAEVEEEIRQTLAVAKATHEIRTIGDTIDDEFAGGASVAEVGEEFGLAPQSVTVDQNGRDQDENDVDLGPVQAAIATAFAMEADEDPRPVRSADGRVWVQVDSVIAAADRDYDAVTDKVETAFIADRDANRLAQEAEAALAAIDSGKSVADVAADLGLESAVSAEFSRAETAPDVQANVAAAAFEGGKGHTGMVISRPGEQVVFEVTEVIEPAFFEGAADLAPVVDTLNQGLANTLLFAVVQGWQSEVGAQVNQPVFLAATGRGEHPNLQY